MPKPSLITTSLLAGKPAEGLEVQDDDEIAADPQEYADDDMDCWTDDGDE